ncbi:MAG TPA: RagB/SusD family nutrient uptake outer membrane protein [Parapedobacter sp.]|uniref:RagB/SusD family nutrient uptake outer membrane protein n=1 Tax=Parapedobacter sp. TaxID=1958893 RepID=UPI002C72A47D|nr:RagB/SusD family nutrient uptake outer membrane protein [Parapedobacter sp.]HWK55945.1 RagB/SusD family nutrient uptake outer membrane protein [Parapedobacter sp.]
MKKLIAIMVTAGVLATSCSDFLTEVPKDEIAPNQFFKNSDHAYNAVNSLYRTGAPSLFGASVYAGSRLMFGPYMSGLVDNDYKGQEVHVQHAQELTLNGVNMSGYLGGFWRDMYLGISRANNAIKYIPTTPGLAESEANKLLAEARFFRAMSYYYLVRFFGDVPLVTEPYESLENLYVERTPVVDVYALIIEDLTFAAQDGMLAETTMSGNGNRITQGAAQSLLAEAYLTMSGYPLQADRYADAAREARDIISSGVYSLTQHDRNAQGEVVLTNSAYNKARIADNLPNEQIYYYEYTADISDFRSGYTQYAFPVSMAPELAYAIFNNAYRPTAALLRAYDSDADLRIQEKQYFHSSLTRADGTVANFNTAPHIWFDEEASLETATSGKDLPIMTYANILLVAAEAIAQSEGVTAEAIDYLAQVRSRAYWKQTTAEVEADLADLSPQQFVEEVWKERLRELLFEFHIWFDILRTRQFPVTGDNGEIDFVNVIGHQNNFGATYSEDHLLFPIPDEEMQRNPSLTPNPIR